MTTIRAQCPACGDVRITTKDVTVRLFTDDDNGSYWYRCPGCEGPVSKPASSHNVELLVSSGVRMEMWRRPAELLESRSGPPLTLDDLLDFHVLLQRDDWMDGLSHADPRSPAG
jgi:predicted RNA-binding Zn-ribbon protein involved in translation (DUF1610 family)